jgi:predicted metal-dependent phosphoesterase TrpH
MGEADGGSVAEATDGNPWALPGEGGSWYRGNLHCHTTESDGRLSPQETVDWFAGAGYHFLALTDHNRIADPSGLHNRGMCLLPSTELTASGGELRTSYHLIGLGLPVGIELPPTTTPAVEAARWLQARGAVVFTAHPHWSGLTVADLLAVETAGIEIFNGGTVLDSNKGEALTYWDEGLAKGARWWGIAVDDTHWHTIDRGLGWVVARAPELSVGALLHALARGHFYSTTGPAIHALSITAGEAGELVVEVQTSPCAAIYCLGFGSRNLIAFDTEAVARGEVGTTITQATFRTRRQVMGRYLRIQCMDWQRRSAWSNPLFL